ncbi:beta-glucanase [Nonlabens sp. YIK11]|nr:beta-glucanase [Nonlabens sp. YIK11]
MPVDFSESLEVFEGFGGSSFSASTDPNDSANQVGRFLNNGRDQSQGFFLDLERVVDLDFRDFITMDFYATDNASHNVLLKLERGSEQDVEVSAVIPGNSQDTWQNLTFDYSAVQNKGSYSRITIFIDNGALIEGTYLIDNIDDGSEAVDNNVIDEEYDVLVWSDEFDSPNGAKQPINSENWFHQTQLPAGGNWYNGEIQHYTDRIDNSYVENGFLHIVAKRERFTDQNVTKDFTSARLNSKFAFTYGRVDVRARLPLGEGTWPAIWTLGKDVNEDGGYWDDEFGTANWPASGEIDIMEHGLGQRNETSSALHSPCDGCFGATRNYRSQFVSDVTDNWHIYSVNWSPNQITFLVDNEPFYTYNPEVKDDRTWPFAKDHYLLLNVALGGISGNVEPGFTQSPMIIDYVKVYQNQTLGIGEVKETDFQLFPNPATDLVTIQSQQTIDSVQLYSMLGTEIPVNLNSANSFAVENVASGMYLVKVTAGNTTTTKRLLIQ